MLRGFIKLVIKLAILFVILVFIANKSLLYIELQDAFEPVYAFIRFLLFAISLNLISELFTFIYRRKKKLKANNQDNITKGIKNIYYLLIVFAGIFALIRAFGYEPKELITSLSIVAAAIAIVGKEYIMDVLSGMALSFSTIVEIGDEISVDDIRGKVIDISISKTYLLNDEDDVIYIPNNLLFSGKIINYSQSDVKKTSIDFEIEISNLTSVESLENELIMALDEYKEYIRPNSYNLKTVTIKKDHFKMNFQYIIEVSDRKMERDIRKKAFRRVVDLINQKNHLA